MAGRPSHPRPPPAAATQTLRERLRGARAVFRQVPGTLRLVWEADRRGTAFIALLTAILALLPAAIAWIGKLIVDGVVLAARSGLGADRERVLWLVAAELLLMAIQLSAGRLLGASARAPARRAREPRQRADPREGARARAPPLRGRRRLRQDAERAARGVGAAALARDAGVRDRAERRHPRRALRAPPPPLARERPRHRRGVDAGVPRRGAALGGLLPALDVARARRGGGSTTSSGSSPATAT